MKSETAKSQSKLIRKVFLITIALMILAVVYIFQRVNLFEYSPFYRFEPWVPFIINRTSRLVVNDLACFILIYALFEEKKYLRIAFYVFLIELIVILPLYFILKLGAEGPSEISSPLLSQVHRLIVNPTLMLLLIAGFFYQKYRT